MQKIITLLSFTLFSLVLKAEEESDNASNKNGIIDIAMNDGEIKPAHSKWKLLADRNKSLSESIKEKFIFDTNAIGKRRWPSQMHYDGVGAIKVLVFGIDRSQEMFKAASICDSLFQKTNVEKIKIYFYKSEESVTVNNNLAKYEPRGLLYSMVLNRVL